MTDAHPAANDQTPRAELTPRDLPSPREVHEFHETADHGDAPEVVTPVIAGSGSANAGDAYPGVVPPADWFQAPEEAAPSGQPFMEPVRPENQASGAVVPASPQDDGPVADDSASENAEYDHLTGERDVEPVVGPTEARWGRPGGPGFIVPQGTRYGLYDPAGRSGWQLSHGLWQDSGILWETPEGLHPDDASLPWRAAAPPVQPDLKDAPVPGPLTSSDVQLTPMLAPTTRPQPVPPDAVPPDGRSAQSTRAENVLSEVVPPLGAPTASDTLPRREGRPVRPEYRRPAPPSRIGPQAPVPPARTLPPDQRPGLPPPPAPRPGAQPPRMPLPRVPQPQARPPQAPLPQARPPQARPPQARPPQARPPQAPLPQARPPQARPPQGQPPQARPPQARPPQGQPPQARPWEQRPVPHQQMPWEEPRPAAEARRDGRSRGHWQAARVGVPIVVILAVGAGALALLTGKAHEALESTGSLGTAASDGSNAATAPGGTAGLAFPGYPGLRGSVQVTSLASDGAVQVAVGSADGHAALWRRAGAGAWILLRNVPALQQNVILTSIAHGPDGWLAVGNVSATGQSSTATVGSTGQAPVILTSTDGVTWKSAVGNAVFAGPGFTVNAVAANASGYVIVGEQVLNNAPTDAMWFTANLASWTRGGDTIASSVSSLSSGMSDSKIFAVAATSAGFVAVGTHNGCHTAWVTSDGQHWKSYDIPKPGGSQDPLLNHVAVMGDTVVATGDLGVKAGRIPLIVVSKNGGVNWQSTPIGNYGAYSGPQGTVTAISSDASGFIAAGLTGAPGHQQAVTWTSPDGISWSQATRATGGTQAITALAPGAGSVSSIATVMAKFGTQAIEVTP